MPVRSRLRLAQFGFDFLPNAPDQFFHLVREYLAAAFATTSRDIFPEQASIYDIYRLGEAGKCLDESARGNEK